MLKHPILLASSSAYRAQLLNKLRLPFIQASPNIDESQQHNESAEQLVQRLSMAKVEALAMPYPDHYIIGSDQALVAPDGQLLGKPLTIENAIKQLTMLSGERVIFYTGLTLLSPATVQSAKTIQTIVEPFTVYFKHLSAKEIESYVYAEKPLDCAGSFKSEGLGICLFTKLSGDDPNSLVGLPLIRLCELFSQVGIKVLA